MPSSPSPSSDAPLNTGSPAPSPSPHSHTRSTSGYSFPHRPHQRSSSQGVAGGRSSSSTTSTSTTTTTATSGSSASGSSGNINSSRVTAENDRKPKSKKKDRNRENQLLPHQVDGVIGEEKQQPHPSLALHPHPHPHPHASLPPLRGAPSHSHSLSAAAPLPPISTHGQRPLCPLPSSAEAQSASAKAAAQQFGSRPPPPPPAPATTSVGSGNSAGRVKGNKSGAGVSVDRRKVAAEAAERAKKLSEQRAATRRQTQELVKGSGGQERRAIAAAAAARAKQLNAERAARKTRGSASKYEEAPLRNTLLGGSSDNAASPRTNHKSATVAPAPIDVPVSNVHPTGFIGPRQSVLHDDWCVHLYPVYKQEVHLSNCYIIEFFMKFLCGSCVSKRRRQMQMLKMIMTVDQFAPLLGLVWIGAMIISFAFFTDQLDARYFPFLILASVYPYIRLLFLSIPLLRLLLTSFETYFLLGQVVSLLASFGALVGWDSKFIFFSVALTPGLVQLILLDANVLSRFYTCFAMLIGCCWMGCFCVLLGTGRIVSKDILLDFEYFHVSLIDFTATRLLTLIIFLLKNVVMMIVLPNSYTLITSRVTRAPTHNV